MPLKAVIFDYDGVVVDSEHLHFEAILEVAKAATGIDFDYDFYLKHYIQFDDRDAFREVYRAQKMELDEASGALDALCTKKQAVLERLLEEGHAPEALPGAVDLIKSIAAKPLPLAIGSGATARDIELMNKALGIQEHFAIVVAADHVTKSKPDPETYLKALSQLQATCPGLLATECLVIEDTSGGAQSAIDAGIPVLGVATTGPAEKLAHCNRVETNLAGVTVDQLMEWFP